MLHAFSIFYSLIFRPKVFGDLELLGLLIMQFSSDSYPSSLLDLDILLATCSQMRI